MITNLHQGNEAWLGGLRGNVIRCFELRDVKRTNGYLDLNPTEFFSACHVKIVDVLYAFSEDDIKTGEDLNELLMDLEKRGLDEYEIDDYLLDIIVIGVGVCEEVEE